MPLLTPKNRLAVILHADIAGSTQLVRRNTTVAHQRIQQTFDTLGRYTRQHSGSIREQRGDALLSEFKRGSDAVLAALLFQHNHADFVASLQDEIIPEVRIGIAIGEVFVADGTISGTGVILAQRLEQLGEPGDVIVQNAVRETIPDQLNIGFSHLGEHQLPGFEDSVAVFRVKALEAHELQSLESRANNTRGSFTTNNKIPVIIGTAVLAGGAIFLWNQTNSSSGSIESDNPGNPNPLATVNNASLTDSASDSTGNAEESWPVLAILPFADKGAAQDSRYVSDGLTEDLISAMSKFSSLFVMSWNAVSGFSSRNSTLSEINSQYNIDYLVTGSIKNLDNHIEFQIELVRAENGHVIWTNRYKDSEENLFSLRNKISKDLATRLSVKLSEQETRRANKQLSGNFANYKNVLLARQALRKRTRKDLGVARNLLQNVIKNEPSMTPAYIEMAWSYIEEYQQGWSEWPERVLDKAHQLLINSISMDDGNARAHSMLARLNVYLGKPQEAYLASDRSLALNPNDPEVHATRGIVYVFTGRSAEAISSLELALKYDPHVTPVLNNLGVAYYLTGNTLDAIQMLERGAREQSETTIYANLFLIAAYSATGQKPKARESAAFVRQKSPFFSVDEFLQVPMISTDIQRENIALALREAGL